MIDQKLLQELQLRLARGEITQDQYLQIIATLESTSIPPGGRPVAPTVVVPSAPPQAPPATPYRPAGGYGAQSTLRPPPITAPAIARPAPGVGKPARRMLWLAVGVCSFIVALVVVGLVVNSRNSKNAPATATSTATPAVTPVVATPAPLAPTPAPPAAVPPGMVTLQAGTFWLGCADGVDTQCDANEKPGHEIQVKLFSMMTREVTVAEYEKCVTVGVCTRPRSHKDRRCNWGANNREQHPMNCVSLADAQAYCHWRGGRLPTTIEWERAARGADKRIYPWGNNPATCSLAVIDDCHSSGTLPVGSRPSGATPEGLLDMAGNVYEWTQEGEARGGGWASGATKVRASRRVTTVKRDAAEADLGFRCAAGL